MEAPTRSFASPKGQKGRVSARHCIAGASLAFLVVGCGLHHEMGPRSPCPAAGSSAEWDWLGPTDPLEGQSITRWCDMVGSPHIKPAPAAQFGRSEDHDSLAVFSWNVDVGAGDLLSFMEEEVGLSCRLGDSEASARFPQFVVLVQEAFRWSSELPPVTDQRVAAMKRRSDARQRGTPDIVEVAEQCGLAFVYVPSGRNGVDDPGERLHDKGSAILSTLPLSDFKAVVLPFETERKVAVAATVPLGSSDSLRVVNVHLEVTSSFHRVLLTGNQTRLRQTEGLIEALNRVEEDSGGTLPILLGGDFNTWSGRESSLKSLWVAFPDSPEWDGKATRGPFPTDHLFFRQAQRGSETGQGRAYLVSESYRPIGPRLGSDHHARFAWVSFGGGE